MITKETYTICKHKVEDFINLDRNDYTRRFTFTKEIGWHIPNQKLIDLLVSHSPMLSVGCGLAVTEKIAQQNGCDIIMTDLDPTPNNNYCSGDFSNIIQMDAVDAVKKYSNRNLFMAWPPYDNPMAYNCVKHMKIGKILIYVGEGGGGCTGDDQFHNFLYTNFEQLDTVDLPRWFGINDYGAIYKKQF